ncbi:hypothetical protein ABPG77_008867 [Micractinium sp. CCAP 211/92]
MAPRRYFLLRCAEDRVIANAARTNTWPVSLGIVDRINKVFASGDEVTFIFTITMSGHFQGAARMASPASDEGRNLPTCKIEWLYRGDVPYTNAEHLINPLSDPPQPVRAGKDGTEIDPKVAEELLGLLQKAAANPKPAPTAAPAGGNASPHSGQPTLPAAAANAGGMPGMVGASLMGMPDPTFMMVRYSGFSRVAETRASTRSFSSCATCAGMMNPLATAMMMGSMQSSAAGRAAVAPSDAGAAERGTAGPKADPQPGPPPGFEGGGMQGRRHGTQDEWEEQQQRFDPRFDGPRGVGPPFRNEICTVYDPTCCAFWMLDLLEFTGDKDVDIAVEPKVWKLIGAPSNETTDMGLKREAWREHLQEGDPLPWVDMFEMKPEDNKDSYTIESFTAGQGTTGNTVTFKALYNVSGIMLPGVDDYEKHLTDHYGDFRKQIVDW